MRLRGKSRVRKAESSTVSGVTTLRGEITKLDVPKRNFFGWAYVTHDKDGVLNVDKSGEFIDSLDELEGMAYDFVLNSRDGGVNHARDRANKPIVKSRMIESVVFTPAKCESMGIPPGVMPNAWWTGFHTDDDETWEDVEAKRLTAFSIHGTGVRKTVGL